MLKRALFFLPATVLAIVTCIRYSIKESAYGFTDEPLYGSFSILSLVVPLFYLIALIAKLMRTADDDRGFYIKSSIVILICYFIGVMAFILSPAFNAT